MANPTCRTWDRSADAGAYCSSCAADIMAKASTPHLPGRRKKIFPGQGTLPPRPEPKASDTSGQQPLVRYSRLSGTRCNDMRKLAACWTCGRTFWMWRPRERNFCSGKCRVRHHRSALRKPSRSTSGRTPAGTG